MTAFFKFSASHTGRRLVAGAFALTLILSPLVAEARLGGGSSFGSRGTRTYSAPPSTSVAPRPAAPMERSMTPQTAPNVGGYQQPGNTGGFFGGGLGRGLIGGLLGAGLFGMLFGGGMFGGLGGLSSIFGLLIQAALIFFVVKFAIGWFARRQQPSFAGAAPSTSPFSSGPSSSMFGGAGQTGGQGGGFGSGFGSQPSAPATQPLTLDGADYQAFEKLLVSSQAAYTAEDLGALRRIGTPEMASYFAEQVADNAKRGVINKVSDVRFEKGDLSEAWRERDADYATVAMRFSLIDATYDRASGRLVEGNATVPAEATEVWTFRRSIGSGASGWVVSGIQQA